MQTRFTVKCLPKTSLHNLQKILQKERISIFGITPIGLFKKQNDGLGNLSASPHSKRRNGGKALTPKGIETCFVQDISPEEASLVYATQGPLAARCFDDKNRSAAWRSKPSWYIVADKDRTIPPAVERDSAARMKADTLTLASSHVPMLSQPERVVEVITKAVGSVVLATAA